MNRGKVGILTPLYARPDFARMAALQFAHQARTPDLVAFFQNGPFDNYEWILRDLTLPYAYQWIHHPQQERSQSIWYATPLKVLLDNGCDYFFWCDQDDIYLSNHVSDRIADLVLHEADMVVNARAGVLKLQRHNHKYEETHFTAHSPGGVSSSMAFNRRFAQALYEDLLRNAETAEHFWADNVVSEVTMPRFRVHRSHSKTSVIYACHPGTVSSSHWLNDLPERPAAAQP